MGFYALKLHMIYEAHHTKGHEFRHLEIMYHVLESRRTCTYFLLPSERQVLWPRIKPVAQKSERHLGHRSRYEELSTALLSV